MYITFSKTLSEINNINVIFDNKLFYIGEVANYESVKAVVGWGVNKYSSYARSYSSYHNIPYIALEDGFIRSLNIGSDDNNPISIIEDEVGIYYDATRPSKLENILNFEIDSLKNYYTEAQYIIDLIKKHNLSKYNHALPVPNNYFRKNKINILVVDQTYNDMSVLKGLANEDSFTEMLHDAVKNNPNADIYLKVHPEVLNGKKNGYLYPDYINNNVKLITEDYNPISILKFVDKIYTVSSQLGFEGLIMGKEVYCYGMPFYAGWGLTQDKINCDRRELSNINLLDLVAAALIKYPKYIDQLEGKVTDPISAIDKLLFLKEVNDKNKGSIFCFACGTWRYRRLRTFLKSTFNKIYFVKNIEEAKYLGLNIEKCKAGEHKIYVWGSSNIPQLEEFSRENQFNIGRIEDGFIRSIGLGSDLIQPLSLCIDNNGIYYDPNSKSDLENILLNHEFDDNIIERANSLIGMINNFNLSKYNIGAEKNLHYPSGSKKVILVPGQVEDDASIRKGCVDIRDNLNLLKHVRKDNPRAFIIYKIHPDIIANNRKGHVKYELLDQYCDVIEEYCKITDLFNIVDEVHTMTSLAGFEALIRGKVVHTYGLPFYSGWGLTIDKYPNPRRNRKLTLAELVAGSLILYPRYYNWDQKHFEAPENTIKRIHNAIHQESNSFDMSTFKRRLKQVKIYVSEVLSA